GVIHHSQEISKAFGSRARSPAHTQNARQSTKSWNILRKAMLHFEWTLMG
ncbi:hypothetical protein A2U01_0067636, partial [Trifolium medium]|nr:hypothetical protein [Trifolium medium]